MVLWENHPHHLIVEHCSSLSTKKKSKNCNSRCNNITELPVKRMDFFFKKKTWVVDDSMVPTQTKPFQPPTPAVSSIAKPNT